MRGFSREILSALQLTRGRSDHKIPSVRHERRTIIQATITLAEAAKRLNRNSNWVRGMCDAFGIELLPVARSLLMTEAEFRRIADHDKRLKDHAKRMKKGAAK